MLRVIKGLIGCLVIGSVLLAACKSPDATPTYLLGINQSARLGSDVVVRVDSILDGRCPTNPNVLCLTGGVATAQLTISKGVDSQRRQLYVGPDKKKFGSDSTVVLLGNLVYSIVLRNVVPYPKLGAQPKDQQALVLISPL